MEEIVTTTKPARRPRNQQLATPSPMGLIQMALAQGADIDKLERLIALNERAMARDSEMAFNVALASAQSEMRRVQADSSNPQTRSKYASYAAIDRAIRPIYAEHGFALSFNTADAASPEVVRVLCTVSHVAGCSREYHIDMPADGKGAKGNDVMTKTHASGSAIAYGMRYLVKMIFNVAVGESDDDGNGGNTWEVEAGVQEIEETRTREDLLKVYSRLHDAAIKSGNMQALKRYTEVKDQQKRTLGGAA